MAKHGGKREGAGRKPKVEEQKVAETLQPMHHKAVAALNHGLEQNERWAVELFWKYYYGLPKQQHDHTSNGQSISVPIITIHGEH